MGGISDAGGRVEGGCQWDEMTVERPPLKATGLERTTRQLLEDPPYEVGDQGEYQNHEAGNPDQKPGG